MLRSIVYRLIKQDDTLLEQLLIKFGDKQHLSREGKWEWRLQELKGYAASHVFDHAEKVLGEGPSAGDDDDNIGKWLREDNG